MLLNFLSSPNININNIMIQFLFSLSQCVAFPVKMTLYSIPTIINVQGFHPHPTIMLSPGNDEWTSKPSSMFPSFSLFG